MKKTIIQRLGDGTETPLEDEAMAWPTFDRIYRRQNQLRKVDQILVGRINDDDDNDDESVSTNGSNLGFDEEAGGYEVKIVQSSDERKDSTSAISRTIRSLMCTGKDESENHPICSIICVPPSRSASPTSPDDILNESPSAESRVTPVACDSESIQQSGESTYESPKAPEKGNTSVSQKDIQSPPTNLIHATIGPPLKTTAPTPRRHSKRNATRSSADSLDVVPRSIPATIKYSLRSAIGDGTVRQKNSHNLMDQRLLRPNGCAVDVSYWSHRGKRSYMEDRFVIEHVGSTSTDNKENSLPITLLAVFDGHGGSAASQFCSDWISSYIRKKNEYYPDNISLAVESAFIRIDSDFVSSGLLDGTTACAVTIFGKRIMCCNSGDSRAIIVKKDGSVVALSIDHKPDRDDETKRINDLGGRVIHWGRWRVEGVLAVSRSIGDAKLKPYVTAEPEIVEHEIETDDMFLVIASDGVWDTMSSDLVAKFVIVNTCNIVNKSLEVDDKLLRWTARQVCKRARENGSNDNTSCIVARLNGVCD
jgi:serine/threonine protein phosphatase PrpC